MRTLFITCFTGLIARNILATRAFEKLCEISDLRLVILAPESRAAVLDKEFGGRIVFVETVATPLSKGLDHLFWILATNLLASRTRRVQRRAKLARDGNWIDYVISSAVGFLGRFRSCRRIFRALAAALGSDAQFEYLFEKYRPTLLFATDVYTPFDVKLMRLAKSRGIKTVGMVRSWDNVTSKTLLTFIPEIMVVNTNRIKEELNHYGDVPLESVTSIGIPHYDHYRTEGRIPRETFFKKFGLDPQKKLILFTPPSDRYLKHDPVAPVVLKSLEQVDAQVLIRVPLVGRADLGNYRLGPKMVLDEPGASPDFTDVHLSRAADAHLADSIYHSDLLISWASTTIIDALVFDKPVVLVGFDAAPRPYGLSIRQYYDYDHQRDIIERGGVRFAKNPEELVYWVRRYLADPSLDSQGRARTRREFCGELDGKSGKRLADYLLEVLNSKIKVQNAK